MTDHDWAPLAPGEDDALMCTVCCQCQCCETPSEECPGAWVPDQKSSFQQIDPNTYRVSGLKRSAITMRYIGEGKE